MWHDDLNEFIAGGGKLTDVRKAIDDQGLKVPSTICMLKGWCEPDGPAYDAGIDECKRRLEQVTYALDRWPATRDD